MLSKLLPRLHVFLNRSYVIRRVLLVPQLRGFFNRSPPFLRFLSARFLLTSGGSVGLALSLFGPSKKGEKTSGGNSNLLTDVIRETDALYDAYMVDNAYTILKKYSDGRCTELLWRLARVLCEKGKLTKDKVERKRLMYEAYETIQRALQFEDEDGSFGAHKWFAIILNYVGEYEGTKEQIKKAYEIRRHFEKALDRNPNDATTWHLLGTWHFTFADMSSITRMIAKTVFQTPPSSTYEEAMKYFEKAEYISPNFYSTNTFYMAEINDRLGKKEAAIELYVKAFKMPVLTADDMDVHVKALRKLEKYGIDCSML